MDNFSELAKNAIAEGDDLESAMRKAVATAAKEAVESLLRIEVQALLGYAKYDPEGRNSGDSRNGSCERTVRTSAGPIAVKVPRGTVTADANRRLCPNTKGGRIRRPPSS